MYPNLTLSFPLLHASQRIISDRWCIIWKNICIRDPLLYERFEGTGKHAALFN